MRAHFLLKAPAQFYLLQRLTVKVREETPGFLQTQDAFTKNTTHLGKVGAAFPAVPLHLPPRPPFASQWSGAGKGAMKTTCKAPCWRTPLQAWPPVYQEQSRPGLLSPPRSSHPALCMPENPAEPSLLCCSYRELSSVTSSYSTSSRGLTSTKPRSSRK